MKKFTIVLLALFLAGVATAAAPQKKRNCIQRVKTARGMVTRNRCATKKAATAKKAPAVKPRLADGSITTTTTSTTITTSTTPVPWKDDPSVVWLNSSTDGSLVEALKKKDEPDYPWENMLDDPDIGNMGDLDIIDRPETTTVGHRGHTTKASEDSDDESEGTPDKSDESTANPDSSSEEDEGIEVTEDPKNPTSEDSQETTGDDPEYHCYQDGVSDNFFPTKECSDLCKGMNKDHYCDGYDCVCVPKGRGSKNQG